MGKYKPRITYRLVFWDPLEGRVIEKFSQLHTAKEQARRLKYQGRSKVRIFESRTRLIEEL